MQKVQGRGFDGPVSLAFQSFLHSCPENVLKHQLKQLQKTPILDVQYTHPVSQMFPFSSDCSPGVFPQPSSSSSILVDAIEPPLRPVEIPSECLYHESSEKHNQVTAAVLQTSLIPRHYTSPFSFLHSIPKSKC